MCDTAFVVCCEGVNVTKTAAKEECGESLLSARKNLSECCDVRIIHEAIHGRLCVGLTSETMMRERIRKKVPFFAFVEPCSFVLAAIFPGMYRQTR